MFIILKLFVDFLGLNLETILNRFIKFKLFVDFFEFSPYRMY